MSKILSSNERYTRCRYYGTCICWSLQKNILKLEDNAQKLSTWRKNRSLTKINMPGNGNRSTDWSSPLHLWSWSKYVTKEFNINDEGNMDLYYREKYPFCSYCGISVTMYDYDTNCKVTMGKCPLFKNIRHPYKNLATDYKTYDISYKWTEKMGGLFKWEDFAIYSREEIMSKEIQNKVRAIVTEKLPHMRIDCSMHWTE